MDAKGRIGLPTRYHERVSAACQGKFVITLALSENCLTLYTLPEWERIEAGLAKLPATNPSTAKIKRRLIGHATEVNMDASGRLLISPELRQLAGLQKSIVLTGQGNKCEIWDKPAWDALNAKISQDELDAPDISAALNDLAL